MTVLRGYVAISPDYAYASLSKGAVIMQLATAREVYFQPGDQENDLAREVEAFLEMADCIKPDKYRAIVDSLLGEYFA